jgi:hypothetical protein
MGARGGCPEGESGLQTEKSGSASSLICRCFSENTMGIQLGDTVSPCVSPCCIRPMPGVREPDRPVAAILFRVTFSVR